ncbi:hypothetical protein CDD80_5835 [Ophiocordyceps camponoti-rufipedis]|uniref:alpha-glucosidase n=1 Tax=Ophiocordyceps camponoti-rufipedis TaxID=2004952 RepID=A0A2C5ZG42_9HYPO|nr:hypothetical protein CDD80_5835 [Ophiocordyceps camponoti-rufipedis]
MGHSPGLWSRGWTAVFCLVIALFCVMQPAASVKEHDFKKCDQSGFCQRNRAYADNAAAEHATWTSPYRVDAKSAVLKDGQLHAMVIKTLNAAGETARFPMTASFLKSGAARLTVDEERRRKGDIELRHDSRARKERYHEAEKWAIVGGLELDKDAKVAFQDKTQVNIQYGPGSTLEAVIKFEPFEMEFRRGGESHVRFNGRGLLNMEHWRPKVEKKEVEGEAKTEGQEAAEGDKKAEDQNSGEDESTWWDESFGGNTDTKPRGPESVALDVSFLGYDHVFGIPEHAGPLSLKQTRGGEGNYGEPYRLYNLDVFEYILDSPMTLYGAIPLMQAHRKGSTVGVFWLNAAETWIDIVKGHDSVNAKNLGPGPKTNTHTHWISESGILDVFVLMGPTPHDLTRTYGELTGYTAMPQEFSIGYHQCRWNYISDDDVRDVDRKMDKAMIPYDVIWLDIEYTDDRKYFTWEPHSFSDPIGTGQQLAERGRKLVVIIDPHIKKLDGYPINKQMTSQDLAVHNKDGETYEGWCWPGSSNWIDCFNPKANEWWKSLFKYDTFKGTRENTFIWNDMNEPSVFNGPETTMPKDNLHHGGWEHRDVHNLNGLTFQNATYEALVSRKKGEVRRPFVLTRSFYSGSQRLGAMWTGDNQAAWDHLAASIPMVLNQGISGFPFAGADVGGFFGNPEKELMARWYQAGAFYPFFRGHAHIDSRRREPYLLGEPYTAIVTAALRLRYSLLPAWYTAFFHAHRDGSPIVRPMFWTHPAEEDGFAIDDQMFLGSTGLLVKPVTEQGKETADVWIPDDERYYDYSTYALLSTQRGKRLTVRAALNQIPLLMRGGHVFPRRDTPRRSSGLMRFDDYTLVVTASKSGSAVGELYVDDGDTFDFQKGQYIHRRFRLSGNELSSVNAEGREDDAVKAGPWLKKMDGVFVDKIIVVGAPAKWKTKEVSIESEGKKWTVKAEYHEASKGTGAFLMLGRVGAKIGKDWRIVLGK